MNVRCTQDNVIVVMDPIEKVSKGGIHIPDVAREAGTYRKSRFATVIASGPGYYEHRIRRDSTATLEQATLESKRFIPNETQPGMRVVVDWQSGHNYDFDLTVPRHNKGTDFMELFGESREFRVVREQEILAIVEDG